MRLTNEEFMTLMQKHMSSNENRIEYKDLVEKIINHINYDQCVVVILMNENTYETENPIKIINNESIVKSNFSGIIF